MVIVPSSAVETMGLGGTVGYRLDCKAARVTAGGGLRSIESRKKWGRVPGPFDLKKG